MSIMSTSSFLFRMNGHQNEAFSCLIGALNNPRKVNGYGADYAASKTKDNGNTYLQGYSRCFFNNQICSIIGVMFSANHLIYCKRNHINAFLVPIFSRIFVHLQYLHFFYISFLLHWRQHQQKYRLYLIRKKNLEV